jgi:hypothetical protein
MFDFVTIIIIISSKNEYLISRTINNQRLVYGRQESSHDVCVTDSENSNGITTCNKTSCMPQASNQIATG